jgi:uncharacterized spore protein YtfJ
MEKYLETMSSTLKNGMQISLVFGEAIETQGKTIIPVSKVAGGFGGGEGMAPGNCCSSGEDEEKKENPAHGMGGGGGLHNEAIGVFEITKDGTRFIPAVQMKHLLIFAGMCFAFVWRMSRKKR